MTPKQRAELIVSLQPADAAALTAYGEARNQSVSGIQAVLAVMRNRLATKKWGETWGAVVLAPMQFSCWNEHDPNCAILVGMATELLAHPLSGRSKDSAFDVCRFLAAGMVDGIYPDNTNNSTHYFAPAIVKTPMWANAPAIRQTVIGGHAFYSGVK